MKRGIKNLSLEEAADRASESFERLLLKLSPAQREKKEKALDAVAQRAANALRQRSSDKHAMFRSCKFRHCE